MVSTRTILFVALVFTSMALAVGYVWRAMKPASSPALVVRGTPLPTPARATDATAAPAALRPSPRFFSLELDDMELRGYLKVAALDAPNGQSTLTPLRCLRMHFAAGVGICLGDAPNPWLTSNTAVTLFNDHFERTYTQRVGGYASRARIAPDGKYAAYTVFVAGHSYNDANFSTATHIWEVASGADLGNLETFEVWRAGKLIHEIDFNFWGVTFANDSNRFYATLSSGGSHYLVEGDIARRRMTVIHEGVECPSLSPDNRRIAFKKARGQGEWQLSVLELATMHETPLAEPRSVDDQAEWLDDSTILYQQIEYDSTQNMWISVMRIPADGGGAPTVFASRVASPAVVH
jgi:hypothetical protein